MMKISLRLAILLLSLAVAASAWGYLTATRDPVVRRATVPLDGWPAGAQPLTAVLISDLHVIGPDMPPERLERIVSQINAFRPDLVFIAGDFVSDRSLATRHYPAAAAEAPLSRLRPKLGTYAVLGNHDHWRNAAKVRRALRGAGIKVLVNDAVEAGPLALGGFDDSYTRHADLKGTVAKMRRLAGPRIILGHSPDPFAKLPPDIGLMLAGHTHCGQVSLPLIGPLMTASIYGRRYACGLVRENGKTLIVTAGLGTSMLPIRIGAVPDLWLLTLKGAANPAADETRRGSR